MEVIDGQFYMKGCEWDDPARIRNIEELICRIQECGFLPLFSNSIEGFSVEEYTPPSTWWTGDPASDPWEWRQILARDERVVYGKFFGKKAGFVAKEWFPVFANYRRNGYDFDALFEDEMASYRQKKIMDVFALDDQAVGRELMSYEIKELAGFGKGGEKNFDGVLADLQMQTYLIVSDFRQKRNRKGQAYGWHIAAIETPETKWGYEFVSSGYREEPVESWRRIITFMIQQYPDAAEEGILKELGIRNQNTGSASQKYVKNAPRS